LHVVATLPSQASSFGWHSTGWQDVLAASQNSRDVQISTTDSLNPSALHAITVPASHRRAFGAQTRSRQTPETHTCGSHAVPPGRYPEPNASQVVATFASQAGRSGVQRRVRHVPVASSQYSFDVQESTTESTRPSGLHCMTLVPTQRAGPGEQIRATQPPPLQLCVTASHTVPPGSNPDPIELHVVARLPSHAGCPGAQIFGRHTAGPSASLQYSVDGQLVSRVLERPSAKHR
jgi:hypothetical protein